MATETITLEIDSEAAQALQSVSAEGREKLQVLLGIWLKEYIKADDASLRESMNEISEQAKNRGLTPETLDSILRKK